MDNINKEDFWDFLSDNDPLGLLKEKEPVKSKAKRSVLLCNFEEIVEFFEEHSCEPKESSKDIREFQLYCRLKAIRENPSMVKQLEKYDFNGLLSGENISNITFDDILGDDPLNLLDEEYDESIFVLNNVRKSDRIAPEYIARRKFCKDFDTYKLMFNAVHEALENGTRKLTVYHPEELKPERFYVLGGIMLYLKSVEGELTNFQFRSGERTRFEGRTECIFDNGTTSNMLYRSLDKALQKDGYAISEIDKEQHYVAEDVTEDDRTEGYVYVLRSHHAKLKNIEDIYKIGSTTATVSERIKNTTKESTYLYAGVDVVETYRCYNIHPRELEDKLHTFFDKVRLNINIPDENGVVISPREWFCVRLDVISEAVNLILSNNISKYIYDPICKKIIGK